MNWVVYIVFAFFIIIYSIYFWMSTLKSKKEYEGVIESLEEEKRRIMEGVASAEVYLWHLDIETDELWIQDRFRRLLGYEKDCDLRTQEEIEQMIHPSDVKKYEQLLEKANNGIGNMDIVIRLKHRKGHYVWMHVSVLANYDSKGKLMYMAGAISDVTATLATEKALKEAHQIIEKSKKMNTSFLTRMSHDIRTPLNAITGYVQLVDREIDDELLNKHLEAIKAASDQLVGIMSDIIDAARLEAGEINIKNDRVDLSELMDNYGRVFSEELQNGDVNFQVIYDKSDVNEVLIDEVCLNQILTNLIREAIHKTTTGEIRLLLKILPLDNGRNQLVFVLDDTFMWLGERKLVDYLNGNGIGLPQEVIVEYGLPYTIIYNLVKLMKGRLVAVSDVDNGTRITIELDILPAPKKHTLTMPEAVEEKLLESNALAMASILVVEDNEINKMLVADILRMLNARNFELASNGREALKLFRKNRYDIIFTDILMPEMDGCTLAREVRLVDGDIPIVAMTANVLQEQLGDYYNAGINDYVAKPIDINELKSKLEKYIEKRGD